MKPLTSSLLTAALLSMAAAQPAAAQSIISDTKPIDTTALVAAAPNPAVPLTATVWLKIKNRAALEAALERLYDPSSAQYHQWMSADALAAYAPGAEEVAIVKEELQSHGLTLLADDPQRLSVRARGTLASMESTFHTQIGTFRKGTQTFYANRTPATLSGPAGELTLSVSGLDNLQMAPTAPHRPLGPQKAMALSQAQAAGGIEQILTDRCFLDQPRTVTFGSPPNLPYATYTGNYFDPGSKLCGHSVAQIRAAYGMDAAYARGLQGQGQTIVLIEFADLPTVLSDVNAFSRLNDLPPLRESQFEVVFPDGKPVIPASASSVRQIPADVEWAHAMAPKAHVTVVIPSAPDDEDIQFALYYAISHHLGSIISLGSVGDEPDYGPRSIQPYDQIIALAAASGIAVNVGAGEASDFLVGSSVGGVGVPADSPHATAVGGTSLGIPDGRGGLTETGYEEQLSEIAAPHFDTPVGPPEPVEPFVDQAIGTQGGESLLFAKPAYQRSLQGSGRLMPDVSVSSGFGLLGQLFVFTDPVEGQQVGVWGGTQLASTVFSGMWALANEHAHHRLGQAAPAIAHMARKGKGIRDIVPVGSATNPSGVYAPVIGQQSFWSPPSFFVGPPPPVPAQFFSALVYDVNAQFIYSPNFWFVFGWGLGGALTTAPGWDNMTGYGVPDGMAFIEATARGHEDDK